MTTAYYLIPASAGCAGKLREYFAKQRVANDALLAALKRWGASNVRIYGEGAQTALSNMRGVPGWKFVRSRGWFRPDTKTPEGKKILEEMKALPSVGVGPEQLSDDILSHGLLCWSDGRGLAMHWASFQECHDGGGWVMTGDVKMKDKCKTWPAEAVEITASAANHLTEKGA